MTNPLKYTCLFGGGAIRGMAYIGTIRALEELGIELDAKRNKEAFRGEGLVSTDSSRIKIYLIPTNEELVIARETEKLVK